MKLFFRKLLLTFLFLAAFIVLAGLLLTLLVQFLFWVKPQIMTLVYIAVILSAAILSYAVFLKRWENRSYKTAHFNKQATESYSFRKDYATVLLSRENVIHSLAALTIAVLNAVRIAITAHKPFVGLLIQVVVLLLLFTGTNTLIWCLVHWKWHKSRPGAEKSS